MDNTYIDWNNDTQYLRDLSKAESRDRVREYQKIEKRAKEDGSWLRMGDGTLWEGSPKTWVHMLSRFYLKLKPSSVIDKSYFYLDRELDDIRKNIYEGIDNTFSNGGPVNLYKGGGGIDVNAYRNRHRLLLQRGNRHRQNTSIILPPVLPITIIEDNLIPTLNILSSRPTSNRRQQRQNNRRRRQSLPIPSSPQILPEQPVSTWVSPYWNNFQDKVNFGPVKIKPHKLALVYDKTLSPVVVTSPKEYVMNLDEEGKAELEPWRYVDNLNEAREIIDYGIDYLGSEGYRQRLLRTIPILELEARNNYGINGLNVSTKSYEDKPIRRVTYIPQNANDNPKIYTSKINNRGELTLIKPNQGTFGYINIPTTSDKVYYDTDLTVGHEFGHVAGLDVDTKPAWNLDNMINGFNPYKSLFGGYAYTVLNPIFKKSNAYQYVRDNIEDKLLFDSNIYDFYKKYEKNSPVPLHNALPWELYSDLWGLRMDLLKNGIFDSTVPNNIFTRDLLQQYKDLRFKDGILPRIFHNFSEDDIIWMINNVAQNNELNNSNPNDYNISALGGKVNKFDRAGLVNILNNNGKYYYGSDFVNRDKDNLHYVPLSGEYPVKYSIDGVDIYSIPGLEWPEGYGDYWTEFNTNKSYLAVRDPLSGSYSAFSTNSPITRAINRYEDWNSILPLAVQLADQIQQGTLGVTVTANSKAEQRDKPLDIPDYNSLVNQYNWLLNTAPPLFDFNTVSLDNTRVFLPLVDLAHRMRRTDELVQLEREQEQEQKRSNAKMLAYTLYGDNPIEMFRAESNPDLYIAQHQVPENLAYFIPDYRSDWERNEGLLIFNNRWRIEDLRRLEAEADQALMSMLKPLSPSTWIGAVGRAARSNDGLLRTASNFIGDLTYNDENAGVASAFGEAGERWAAAHPMLNLGLNIGADALALKGLNMLGKLAGSYRPFLPSGENTYIRYGRNLGRYAEELGGIYGNMGERYPFFLRGREGSGMLPSTERGTQFIVNNGRGNYRFVPMDVEGHLAPTTLIEAIGSTARRSRLNPGREILAPGGQRTINPATGNTVVEGEGTLLTPEGNVPTNLADFDLYTPINKRLFGRDINLGYWKKPLGQSNPEPSFLLPSQEDAAFSYDPITGYRYTGQRNPLLMNTGMGNAGNILLGALFSPNKFKNMSARDLELYLMGLIQHSLSNIGKPVTSPYGDIYTLPLLPEEVSIIESLVVPRIPWTSRALFLTLLNKFRDNLYTTTVPDEVMQRVGNGAGGLASDRLMYPLINGRYAISWDGTSIKLHELEHMLQGHSKLFLGGKGIGVPVSKTLDELLNAAYTDDFLTMGGWKPSIWKQIFTKDALKWDFWKGDFVKQRFKEYPFLGSEMQTSNAELRASLLRKLNLSTAPLELLNAYLESLSRLDVINAMKESNGYVMQYLERLRLKFGNYDKIPDSIIDALKKAMIGVHTVAGAAAIAGSEGE